MKLLLATVALVGALIVLAVCPQWAYGHLVRDVTLDIQLLEA